MPWQSTVAIGFSAAATVSNKLNQIASSPLRLPDLKTVHESSEIPAGHCCRQSCSLLGRGYLAALVGPRGPVGPIGYASYEEIFLSTGPLFYD